MSEYLTKEEIKQWRSSLEKITLEEFAARLGKQIEEAKQTNDLVDIVLKGKPYTSASSETYTKTERITSIAELAIEREHQISSVNKTAESAKKAAKKEKETKAETKTAAKEIKKESAKQVKPIIKDIEQPSSLKEEVQIVFKKALTDREQMVFDYFLKNKNRIVYAKDLATLLSLPRDYVYKYIKNLRAKIDGENLKNAEAGGFMLTV